MTSNRFILIPPMLTCEPVSKKHCRLSTCFKVFLQYPTSRVLPVYPTVGNSQGLRKSIRYCPYQIPLTIPRAQQQLIKQVQEQSNQSISVGHFGTIFDQRIQWQSNQFEFRKPIRHRVRSNGFSDSQISPSLRSHYGTWFDQTSSVTVKSVKFQEANTA